MLQFSMHYLWPVKGMRQVSCNPLCNETIQSTLNNASFFFLIYLYWFVFTLTWMLALQNNLIQILCMKCTISFICDEMEGPIDISTYCIWFLGPHFKQRVLSVFFCFFCIKESQQQLIMLPYSNSATFCISLYKSN